MKILLYGLRPGMFWFRIFGRGLSFSTYAKFRPYFSERNGMRNPIFKTSTWRVFYLEKL